MTKNVVNNIRKYIFIWRIIIRTIILLIFYLNYLKLQSEKIDLKNKEGIYYY
jgi:hypothetical protein